MRTERFGVSGKVRTEAPRGVPGRDGRLPGTRIAFRAVSRHVALVARLRAESRIAASLRGLTRHGEGFGSFGICARKRATGFLQRAGGFPVRIPSGRIRRHVALVAYRSALICQWFPIRAGTVRFRA